ncbi:DUF2142 domain-containing protein [Actinomyces sp. B33]|uniref:DUF2142 domain-containing protein n=1 Tax=Actinomyces sp. B33 TaxID=2942131 RepID=UPI002340EB08|nr:DUF2142 domain-containing protein [Actinomyces sp. B33]MDC4232648.1 DUF2142 domain-containing protein [Actinomyces sp. B33]
MLRHLRLPCFGGPRAASAQPRSRWTAALLGALLVVSALVTGIGWVIASPVGASPDDDFHLVSAWCPRPVEESCPTRFNEEHGVVEVEVPQPIGDNSVCYAFMPDRSAQCTTRYSDARTRWAIRYDDGNYPTGFYRFHHLLVQENSRAAALTMRLANLLIGLALLACIGSLSPRRLRQPFLLAMAVSWVPMGLYFIASNNPSSWSITGVFAFATGLYAAARSAGGRRWGLLGCAGAGAILCCSSRPDAAFYLFVVTAAFAFALRWSRALWPEAALALAASTAGVWQFLSNRQASPGGGQGPAGEGLRGAVETAVRTAVALPKYFAGFYGLDRGPGWFDVPIDGTITVLALAVGLGALFLSLRAGTWRTWMAALMVFGSMSGLPVVVVAAGVFDSISPYQPRYILPLLAVLFFLLFAVDAPARRILSRPQAILAGACLVLAHALTLHVLLARYTRGLVGPEEPLDLDFQLQWWWPIPVTPMQVWIAVSLAFGVAVVCLLVLAGRSADAADEVERLDWTTPRVPAPADGPRPAPDLRPSR